MDIFQIFLLVQFTRVKQEMMKDHVLGRDVPSIVFFNNQKLIREACVSKLDQTSADITELKA